MIRKKETGHWTLPTPDWVQPIHLFWSVCAGVVVTSLLGDERRRIQWNWSSMNHTLCSLNMYATIIYFSSKAVNGGIHQDFVLSPIFFIDDLSWTSCPLYSYENYLTVHCFTSVPTDQCWLEAQCWSCELECLSGLSCLFDNIQWHTLVIFST